jgi:hypothetical protein
MSTSNLASYIKALLDANEIRWNTGGSVGGANNFGQPVTITYNFLSQHPAHLSPQEYRNFRAFTTAQQNDLRTALAHYSEVANITFRETNNNPTLQIGCAETYYDFDGDGTLERAGGLATRPATGGSTIILDRG